MKKKCSVPILLSFLAVNFFVSFTSLATPISQISPSELQIPRSHCPTDVETLAKLLLDDIPGYTNRVRQRAIRTNYTNISYVIVAGKPEFEALPLNVTESLQTDESVEQLFFTTLERRYSAEQVFEVQNYHWLFLTKTESGWRMVTVFSRFGSTKPNVSPTPPKETINGTIGQAIRLWLRDCRARQ